MLEYSTRTRPPVSELMRQSTARLTQRAQGIAAEKRAAEKRGDGTAVRRLKVAERALELRMQSLKETYEVARRT